LAAILFVLAQGAILARASGGDSIVDNFNRADSNPVSGNWETASGVPNPMEIVSDELAKSNDTVPSSCSTVTYNGSMWKDVLPADVDIEITIAAKGSAHEPAIIRLFNQEMDEQLQLHIYPVDQTIYLSGVTDPITTFPPFDVDAGDVIGLDIVGTTVQVTRNGSAVYTRSIPSSSVNPRLVEIGSEIECFNSGGGLRLDDFQLTSYSSIPASATIGAGGEATPASCACRQSTGEPVDTANGDFYSSETDASVQTFGPPLWFTRTYDSMLAQTESAAGTPGPLGYGWTDNWNESLSLNDPTSGEITVNQGNGSQALFVPPVSGTCPDPYAGPGTSGTYCALPEVTATLTYNSSTSTYTLVTHPYRSYTFNSSGKLTGETAPGGATLSVAYSTPTPGTGSCPSAASSCETVTAASGRTLVLAFNSSNEITKVIDPLSRAWTYGYCSPPSETCSAGDLVSVTDPLGNITSYTYDKSNGNPDLVHDLLTLTKPNGQTGGPDAGTSLTNVYDDAGQVESQTDPDGNVTSFDYSNMDATTGNGYTVVTDPDGNKTEYLYYGGALIEKVLGFDTGSPSSWTYSPDPNTLLPVAITDPNGNTTTYGYDADGNVTSKTNALGNTWTYTYNGFDERTCAALPLAAGPCSSLSPPAAVTAGASTVSPPSGAPPKYVTYSEFDTDGNPVWTSAGDYAPGGSTASQSRTSYSLYSGQSVTIGSDDDSCAASPPASSLPCLTIDPDGVVSQLGYDSAGDLASSSTPDGNSGGEVAKTSYGYDGDGELTSEVAPDGNLSGATVADFTTTNTYDDDGELTAKTVGESDDSMTARTTSYSYDPNGNLTGRTVAAAEGSGGPAAPTVFHVGHWDSNGSGVDSIDLSGYPSSSGDLVVVGVIQAQGSSNTISSITGGGVSDWTKAVSHATGADAGPAELWYGTVSSLASATITVNFASTPTVWDEISVDEYLTSGSGWSLASAGSSDNETSSADIQFPSLTSPASGVSLYDGYAYVGQGAVGGSTSGFTFETTSGANLATYQTGLDNSTAYAPVGTQSPDSSSMTVAAIFTADASPVPSGLVAAYGFDEGSGTTAADSSGHGNTGTIHDATWTSAGKYGNALDFDGSDSYVDVPSSSSLQLSDAMTIEAWVKPAFVGSAWQDVANKGPWDYALMATADNGGDGPPAGLGSIGGNWYDLYGGTSGLPEDEWSHLAITYDGAELNMYINGSWVASEPASGTIESSDGDLVIGDDFDFHAYYDGTIDELRIYNTALTQTQVQYDMDTPIGSSDDDGTATTTYAYNPDDELTLTTDPDSQQTLSCYDGDGNLTETVPPVGVAANSLTAASCPTIYPAGYGSRLASDATTYAYDALGDKTTITTPPPAGQSGYEETTNAYDPAGQLTSVTAPPASNAGGAPNQVTEYSYDNAGELLTQTTGHGTAAAATTSYCYDPDGNKTATVPPDANTSTVASCATSSPYQTSSAYQTGYAYDSLGELVSKTTPTTSFVTSPTSSYTYDPAGNLLTSEDPNGVTRTNTYTPLDQLATVNYSGSSAHSVDYAYDANGNRVSMIDATGTSTYTYDPFNELTSYQNGAGNTISYSYDNNGNTTAITYPLGGGATWAPTDTVNYSYDNANELTGITDFNGNTITVGNSADGLPNSLALGTTGDTISTTYDPTDTPSDIKLTNSTPTTLQEFSYSDVPSGTISAETDTPSSSLSPADYTYDAQNRVTQMTPGTDSALNYAYDASGNLTTLPTGTSSTTYDDASELTSSTLSGTTTSYTYDSDGNRTQEAHGMTTTMSASYNGAQELTAYNNASADMEVACYDGDGLRQSLSTTSTSCSSPTNSFTWDVSGSLPRLLMDSTNAYIYGDGNTPIEQVNLSSGTAQYLVSDALGSVRGIVSSGGSLTASTSYDAWGNPETTGGLTSSTPFGYAGYYTDPTDLTYNIGRYYDPTTGQFLTVDPLAALTVEAYAYGLDDPVNASDPAGLCASNATVNSTRQVGAATPPLLACNSPLLARVVRNGVLVSVAMTPKGGITWGIDLTGTDFAYSFGTTWAGVARLDRPGRTTIKDQKDQPYPPHGSFKPANVFSGSMLTLSFTGTYEGEGQGITWEVNIRCLVP
jgi:RHS repeat-associated protein